MKVEISEYIAVLQHLLQIKEQRGWTALDFATDCDDITSADVQAVALPRGGILSASLSD